MADRLIRVTTALTMTAVATVAPATPMNSSPPTAKPGLIDAVDPG
jgi:hypothetical protein